jgi:hypothetical protein
MDNEPEDQIEIFGFEMDKDDALHASQAMLIGGALVRANANNKEKQRRAEIARVEQNRQREIQRAADEKAREQQAFDAANDPCPYCHTQISKQAALCPSCRNGFFGIPWGLIKLAISKDPLLVENVTAEKLLNSTAGVRDEYERNMEIESAKRAVEHEQQIKDSQARAAKEQQALKQQREKENVQASKKYKIYGAAAGIFAVLQLVGLLSGGGVGSYILGGASVFGCYYWLNKSKELVAKSEGHWSEKS